RLADELAQHVASRRHNSARVRVAEQALDAHMLRERRTTTNAHGRRGDADGDVAALLSSTRNMVASRGLSRCSIKSSIRAESPSVSICMEASCALSVGRLSPRL